MKRIRPVVRRSSTRSHALRRRLEALEDRTVPAVSVSVAGATLSEIGSPSAFITTGSGGLDAPLGITLGPDGNLYVAGNGGAVRRYNATTGAYIGTFIAQGSGGLSGVHGLAFGPDGHLYVSSLNTDQVLRYNGTTGAYMNAFVAAGAGGLDEPRGLTFGPDGNLYVSSLLTNSVLRYQGPGGAAPGAPQPAPGQSGATFVAPDSGGLFQPFQPLFGPDGHLYLDGRQTAGVLRFDGTTGAFLDTFVQNSRDGLVSGMGMAFDQEGRLYVGDQHHGIHRYDRQGNSIGDLLVGSVSNSIIKPFGLTFDAQGALLIGCRGYDYNIGGDTVFRYDRGVVVSLSAASPTPVTVDYATADGTATAAVDYHALSGTVTFLPGQTSRRVLLATRDDLEVDPDETFLVRLSNATAGAVIGTDTVTVTIADDDGTRQISTAGASAVEGDHTAHFRGAFVSVLPGVVGHVSFDPDGKLYTSFDYMTIDRYDGTTGAFIDQFIANGRLKSARDIAFLGDYLYVASIDRDEVLRFNRYTGAPAGIVGPPDQGVFVTAGSGGLDAPDGLTFGPDANGDGVPELYVSGWLSHSVVRYDGATGAPLGTYVTSHSGGVGYPLGIAFDPSGSYLYVTSPATNQVLKYNALTGAYVGVGASAGISSPRGVTFGSDGLMYVSDQNSNRIMRFATDGAYVDDYVPAGSGGMVATDRMAFGPDGDLYVAALFNGSIMRFGTASEAVFTVSISTPSTLPVTVNYATADGTAIAGIDYMATAGSVTFAPGFTTATVRVPLLNDATAETPETFNLILSGATGAEIADDTGLATITDDDVTKFFVVNDGSPDQTYRYGAPGNDLGISALTTGNAAPRGAASTAAGDKVWVVDANKIVYVYNATGGLLGTWTAGGLNTQAQVEGITLWGNDVWLVDAKQDKVFKYPGAATRLSGSQNATSSFVLNSSNKDPKDLVTDGTHIWVVNDSATDDVFKYSMTGTLLGSWTLSGGGGSPTGITLDPTNGQQHLWVVDSATDRVYQYDNARSRTSGSQSAGATFALAAGNSNPQGIADPPAISIGDATATEGDSTVRFIDTFVTPGSGGLSEAREVAFGPTGDMFVVSRLNNSVMRYDGQTGAFVSQFVTSGSGGLNFPNSLTFDSQGNLYVTSPIANQILRYDGATGAFLGVFVATGAGGMLRPSGVTFGPDGNLYVSDITANKVLRFQGPGGPAPGSFVDVYALSPYGGTDVGIVFLTFGPDGRLYAPYPVSPNLSGVFRATGVPGTVAEVFVPLGSGGLTIGADLTFDASGNLLQGNRDSNSVLRYQGPGGNSPGAFMGSVIPSGAGGLTVPTGIAVGADGNIYVGSADKSQVLRYGSSSQAAFTVRLDSQSASLVTVQYTTAPGTAQAGSDYVTTSGTITFAPGQTSRTIVVRTLDDTLYEGNETFTINLSNPVGATIADGQAIGIITDNEPPLLQIASSTVDAGAAQRSRVTDVSIAFNGLATLPANPVDAFRLTRLGPGGSPQDVTLAVDLSASTATQTIARFSFGGALTEFGSLADGLYRLTILSAKVSGSGQPLDGDANGTAGGDFTLDLHRLYGDVNGDKAVNGLDLSAFRTAFGSTLPNPNYAAELDANGDGAVNGLDLAEFRTRFGTSLP